MSAISFNSIPVKTALIIAAPTVIGITIGLIAKSVMDASFKKLSMITREANEQKKDLENQIRFTETDLTGVLEDASKKFGLKEPVTIESLQDTDRSEEEPKKVYLAGKFAFLWFTIGGLFASSILFLLAKKQNFHADFLTTYNISLKNSWEAHRCKTCGRVSF